MQILNNKEIPKRLAVELLHNPFIGICITDGKGVVLAVNEAQSRITSIPAEGFLGKSMDRLVEEKLLSASSSVEVLKSKQSIMMHQTLSNGKSYEVRGIPIYNDNNEIEYIISYLLDVSELETAKERLYRLQEDKAKIADKYVELKRILEQSGTIVYQSKMMKNIVDMVKKVADRDTTVLITGPSGSGKELIADMLHNNSGRKEGPFLKVNCAAIPEQLLESELFGYEAGAFTGSSQKGKKGLFEAADGGTLLLDEIGEMPLNLQVKLLRVLQEREVRRIGGSKMIKIDIRVVAATNANLTTLIVERKFREDLFYRLNVIEIKLPGLEDRRDDIPLLIEHFMKVFNTKYDTKKDIQWEAFRYLSNRKYPGNVRELQNVVERIVVQSAHDLITLRDAYEAFGIYDTDSKLNDIPITFEELEGVPLRNLMEDYEKRILIEYKKRYGNGTAMARKLKVDQSTMSRKLAKYDLN